MLRIAAILIMMAPFLGWSQTAEEGKSIFTANCAICHNIGKGKLIGPDLAGATERREKEWLFNFIRNSGKVIASGDEIATALFAEFNNMVMPPFDFSDAELESLLAYIGEYKPEEQPVAASTPSISEVNDKETFQAEISYPSWFVYSISAIGAVILVLLFVIMRLVRITKQFCQLERGEIYQK